MAAVTEVATPDLSGAKDVVVVEVLVKPGDTIAPDDSIVVLESDKATMEVPAPFGGTVEAVHVKAGDTVTEGAPLLSLTAAEEEASAETPEPEAAADEQPPKPEEPAPEREDREEKEEEEEEEPAAEGPAAGEAAHASPLARRIARELSVDLSTIQGTGRNGRISKDDVLARASAPAPAAAGLPPWPQVDFAQFGPVEVVDVPRIRKTIASNLHRNWLAIPHVTHQDEADVTELEAFRVRTNDEHTRDGVKLTMVALLLKACAAALKEYPRMNSSLDGDTLVLKRYYHLGVATDTERGLVVPVIRDVDQKRLLELARELAERAEAARAGRLTVDDMQGGTFTISSLGGIGGTGFTPIVNAPEVAILGVARTATRPIWNGSEFTARLMLPLSLSYDHRVIDGADAARFTRTLVGLLQDFRRVLL